MNQTIQALLTALVLASVLSGARAENMAERKQRIMRKYMRERQDIVQSDLGVSEVAQEQVDARVTDSEQFKEIPVEFKRQIGGVAPLPGVRPAPLQRPERNWWLETAELNEDPYADPFAPKADAREEVTSPWSPWSGRSTYDMQSESGAESYGSGTTDDGYTFERTSPYQEQGRTSGFNVPRQTGIRGTDSGWGLNSVNRYGSSPSRGLLQSPFSSSPSSQIRSPQTQTPGYTPYRSSYQIQADQLRRSGGNLQPVQPQYMRPSSYQKWKESNNPWDPTSDNIYLDELMRDQKR